MFVEGLLKKNIAYFFDTMSDFNVPGPRPKKTR